MFTLCGNKYLLNSSKVNMYCFVKYALRLPVIICGLDFWINFCEKSKSPSNCGEKSKRWNLSFPQELNEENIGLYTPSLIYNKLSELISRR